jgi:small conductance mechanosensitive channel
MDALSLENLRGLIELVSAWGLKVLGGIAILLVGVLIARVGSRTARRAAVATLDAPLADFIGSLVYYAIVSVVVISVFGIVGIETASLITILGASSLAIGLALQGSLSNFASGVMLFVFRPFRLGDYVEIGDDVGFVAEIGVFSTQLDTLDNVRIVLPNSHVAEHPVRNWSTNGKRRLTLEIEVAVHSNLAAARGAIEELLRAEPRVLQEPAPMVAAGGFGDTSANLVIRPWCEIEDYWELRYALPERIKDAVEAAGCSLPTPKREIELSGPVP